MFAKTECSLLVTSLEYCKEKNLFDKEDENFIIPNKKLLPVIPERMHTSKILTLLKKEMGERYTTSNLGLKNFELVPKAAEFFGVKSCTRPHLQKAVYDGLTLGGNTSESTTYRNQKTVE